MPRYLKLTLFIVGGLLVFAFAGLQIANAVEASWRDHPLVEETLGPADKAEAAEAFALQRQLGDEVWPGFAAADIPLILFNDRYEFLVGAADAPAPWTVVAGDLFEGKPYFRRDAQKPQAFAVQVGTRWAGSIGTLDRMNREYLLGVQQMLPPIIGFLFPYPFATLSRDQHVVSLLHEAFHAYQATVAPARFTRSEGRHALLKSYPFGVTAFEEGWNGEGRQLAAALRATTDAAARESVRAFLALRESRRQAAGFGPDMVAIERDLEWEEGLAKHVEIRFHEVAAARGWSGYPPGLPQWQQEFARVDGGLGGEDGDYRFYLSGMAEARLLDRLFPGWTARVLTEEISLEELLAEAVGGNG